MEKNHTIDTTYISKGFGEKVNVPDNINSITILGDFKIKKDKSEQIGFKVTYMEGQPYFIPGEIYTLAFLLNELENKAKCLEEIVIENQIGHTVKKGISNEEFESTKISKKYANNVYNLFSENDIKFRYFYKILVRDKNELNLLKSLGLKLNKNDIIEIKDGLPIVKIENENIKKLEESKIKIIELAKYISNSSNEVLGLYEECILLQQKIIRGGIGG